MTEFIIRPAKKEDCSEIIRLIQELADYEKMSDSPKLTVQTLEKDGFDGENAAFECLVTEDKEHPGLIGYALYYIGYTTWLGKTLYLEDIIIAKEHRGKGLGSMLLSKVCKEALNLECLAVNFNVLNWNPAVAFYNKFNAEDITNSQKLHYIMMKKDKIKEIALTGSN